MKPGVGIGGAECSTSRRRGPAAPARSGCRQNHGGSSATAPVRRAAGTNGFTLLEMLAVIVLIGVATAAVAFSVSQGLAGARAATASAKVAAALRATRAQAIVRGQAQVFDVDTRNNRWRIASGQTVQLPPAMHLSITSAREDAPDDHTGRIRFFPDGSSTGGHIVLQSGHRQWQIDVAWLTGAVSVR